MVFSLKNWSDYSLLLDGILRAGEAVCSLPGLEHPLDAQLWSRLEGTGPALHHRFKTHTAGPESRINRSVYCSY